MTDAGDVDNDVVQIGKFRVMGEAIGLEGKPLTQYIERCMDKEAEREREREKEQREREKEQRETAKEIELAKLQANKELDLARLQAEAERARAGHRGGPSEWSMGPSRDTMPRRGTQITMPCFDEKTDLIDNFCTQFEKLAALHGVPEDQWAINISAFLLGGAKDVYHSLAVAEVDDYRALKAALLKHYELSADSYRKMFRETQKKSSETHHQFHSRVKMVFDKWIKMAGAEMTYKGLREMVLKEQVMGSYRRDLMVFLVEKGSTTLDEVAEMAERYEAAHSTQPRPSNGSHKDKQLIGTRPNGNPEVPHRQRGEPLRPQNQPVNSSGRNPGAGRAPLCFKCQKPGHRARECRNQPVGVNAVFPGPYTTGLSGGCANTTPATVNGTATTALLDTGCHYPVIVHHKYVRDTDRTGEYVDVVYANGSRETLPIAYVELESPYIKGRFKAACAHQLHHGVVLGCKYVLPQPNPETCQEIVVGMVETRAARARGQPRALPTTTVPIANTLPGEVRGLQDEDTTLETCKRLALEGTTKRTRDGEVSFVRRRGILYRIARKGEEKLRQLLVPKGKRDEVLRLAHESLLGGHLGIAKTREKVVKQFYWPGVHGDVKRFCLSCDKCQRMAPLTHHRPVPLGVTPIIDEPFSRVAVDIVGPITPASEQGNRYILTVVDYATRYPEAAVMKRIDTETVAEGLLGIWAHIGIPREILTDQGTQFMGGVMEAVYRLLSIRHLTTTPYHPQCNGLVEKFNGTLKLMLKKLCDGHPRNWDRYIPAVLFAYREVPQTSLGFSPFELVYGRTVRGPMSVLRQLWEDEEVEEEVKTTYQYVVDLRNRLEDVGKLARQNLEVARGRQQKCYNRRAKERNFSPGDSVLLLLPQEHNKLQVCWRGPYEIVAKSGGQNYRIRIGEKEKLYHANLLKRYLPRESALVVAMVITEEDEGQDSTASAIESFPLAPSETFKDVLLEDSLPTTRREEVEAILAEHQDVLTERPGRTTEQEFSLKLLEDKPVCCRPYALPYSKREAIQTEIQTMLELGVIEPSESAYSAPVVLVAKKDGSHRFCVDYRRLNRITEFQVEVLPDPDEIFSRIAHARYFSKLDLAKGYWQIPVRQQDRKKLAFATPGGTYQWVVMPFGVQNAPSVFTRLMRRIVDPIRDQGVSNFMDDILIATGTWTEHMSSLTTVLQRLRQAGLTARPTKCHIGFERLDYLGHTLTANTIRPEAGKVEQLRNAKRPTTKTEVRAFLGLAGYYRRYVPNFSAIASPLSDLTRKDTPAKLEWSDACDTAFRTLKERLTSDAIIRLPDQTKDFVLRTDACDTGLGAVLLQDHDGTLFPVAYGSRKLSKAERNYSVTEKECLGIIFGITKFEKYLYGRKFTLQTDHQPLAYLAQAKAHNGRLMRWSLFLQQYQMVIQYIKGKDNVGADCMSRFAVLTDGRTDNGPQID